MSTRCGHPLADEATLTVEILVDAIVGVGFPTIAIAMKATKAGCARFSGNQWNEQWSWDREVLADTDIEQLHDLYITLCEARREARCEAQKEKTYAH